jgi:hypothetical protein
MFNLLSLIIIYIIIITNFNIKTILSQFIIILLLIIIINTFFFCQKNENYINIQDNLSDVWKQSIDYECNKLKNDTKIIDNLLDICNAPNTSKDKTKISINNKLNCRDAIEYQFYNENEKDLWCNYKNI